MSNPVLPRRFFSLSEAAPFNCNDDSGDERSFEQKKEVLDFSLFPPQQEAKYHRCHRFPAAPFFKKNLLNYFRNLANEYILKN